MIYFHYGDEIWYSASNLDVLGNVIPIAGTVEIALELLSDGRGIYRICRPMRIKEDMFYKLPNEMTMIALSARHIE